MATYVLVHGGGHGGWCYDKVAPLLRAEGHEVHAPTLTGLGERRHLLTPDTDLETHITDVVATLFHHDLRDVILAGHSYGGMVITGVADRSLDRIGQLVYLDAAHPRNGESLADCAPEPMAWAYQGMRVVNGVELAAFPEDVGRDLDLFGIHDPGDKAWALARLTPHPWKTFAQKLDLKNEAAVRRIPRTHIACKGNPEGRSPPFRERCYDADRLFEIDTGHDLMITEPRALADMLLQLA
jgi:pimeloyl-ACP methyl ester carboxylesterase